MSPEIERLAGNRKERRVVIETIATAEQPFSAKDLCEMVKNRDPAVSRTTVYRTLRLLRERQLVRMTVLQGGNRVFHLNRPSIFWVCDDCSRIRTFAADEVTEILRQFAETKGFHSVEITVEVHSACDELRRKGFCSQDRPRSKGGEYS
ncbi:MAG TPA: transcriptional repressor [Terrimicrobiaceae bacterium]